SESRGPAEPTTRNIDPDTDVQAPNWDGGVETYDLVHHDTPDTGSEALPPRVGVKKKKKKKLVDPDAGEWASRRVVYEKNIVPTGRPWLLWVFAACLIPLAIDVLGPSTPLEERIAKAIAENPDLGDRLEQLPETSDDPLGTLLLAFPDHRLPGAAFPRDTSWHYLLAAISAVGFLGLILAAWPDEEVRPRFLVGMGLLTGTVGIALLLGFQLVAEVTQHFNLRGGGVVALLFYIVKFIGFSYRCAIDSSIGFGLSLMGFTLGVGLCEELCKAVPVVLYLYSDQRHTWRGATVVGFASGIGFGVSEGVSYSAEMYNGVVSPITYAVRFLSCVALHSIWAGIVALLMYGGETNMGEIEWDDVLTFIVKYLGIAMVLHGLYDVLLKFDHELFALGIAVASFVWLLSLIHRQQVAEQT
ncbi:MAG TPA: PrsW family glutamic-type intramembrane protease, partial [Caulifigura sp.]|nr:PrsW family glutamic-type intramembrane protease [Caulifigura sp.]